MKKTKVVLALIVAFTMTACTNDKTETTKETIVVPAPATTTTTTPEKNTTVVVDKNGVKVATKKVDISVNPEKKK